MKIKMSKDRKSVTVSFRSKFEALDAADTLDALRQLSREERSFYRRLVKRRPAGIA